MNALRSPLTVSMVGLCVENPQPVLYMAVALYLGSAEKSLVKKRKPSLSMMRTGRRYKRAVESSLSDKCVKIEVESLVKLKDITDVSSAVSCPLHPETKSAFQVLKIFRIDYCSVNEAPFDHQEALHELNATV